MDYEHVTVVLDDRTVERIEAQVGPGVTVEDWVERAVADRYGDGETVDADEGLAWPAGRDGGDDLRVEGGAVAWPDEDDDLRVDGAAGDAVPTGHPDDLGAGATDAGDGVPDVDDLADVETLGGAVEDLAADGEVDLDDVAVPGERALPEDVELVDDPDEEC